MINRKTKISYGKNVYNNEEINAVIKTLKKSILNFLIKSHGH